MKTSELINKLQESLKKHGDLSVLFYDDLEECDGSICAVGVAEVKEYTTKDGYKYTSMPYYCKGDSVAEHTVGKKYIVLYT